MDPYVPTPLTLTLTLMGESTQTCTTEISSEVRAAHDRVHCLLHARVSCTSKYLLGTALAFESFILGMPWTAQLESGKSI